MLAIHLFHDDKKEKKATHEDGKYLTERTENSARLERLVAEG